MRMHLSDREPRGPIALMHYSEENIEEDVFDTAVPASSVHLPEEAMNVSDTLQKSMYQKIYFRMLFNQKDFEHVVELLVSVYLCLPIIHTISGMFEKRQNIRPRHLFIFWHEPHVQALQ